jgi:hypothetical protein
LVLLTIRGCYGKQKKKNCTTLARLGKGFTEFNHRNGVCVKIIKNIKRGPITKS